MQPILPITVPVKKIKDAPVCYGDGDGDLNHDNNNYPFAVIYTWSTTLMYCTCDISGFRISFHLT